MAPYQHDGQPCGEQQQNQYDDPPYFAPVRCGPIRREWLTRIKGTMLLGVSGQSDLLFRRQIVQEL